MESGLFEIDSKLEFESDQISNEFVIKTTKVKCSVCKLGDLRPDGKQTLMIIYGREGVRILPHQYMRCNYRVGTGDRKVSCRAGHSLGFATSKGVRIYDDDALKKQFLVVSNQTAFTINYLVEVVGQVSISSGKFEAMAKQYNRFHLMKLPFDVMGRQVELNTDLLNDDMR